MAFATQKSTIKFGGEEKSPAVLFQEFLEGMKPQVQTNEKGESDGKSPETFATAAQEVDHRTQELITKAGGASKLSYSDAMSQVLKADEALAARYSAAQ